MGIYELPNHPEVETIILIFPFRRARVFIMDEFNLLYLLAVLLLVDGASIIQIDSGSYFSDVPSGLHGPSSLNNCGNPANPGFIPAIMKASHLVQSPFPTNKWWSSALWRRCLDNPDSVGSEVIYPHPLALKALPNGLAVSYPQEHQIIQSQEFSFIREYKYSFYPWDFVVSSPNSVPSPQNGALVYEYSDMHVTLFWPAYTMFAIFGRGSPFVWYHIESGEGFYSIAMITGFVLFRQ